MMNKDPIGPHVLSAWANVYLIEIYHSSQFRDNRTTFNAHRLLASFAGTSTNLGVRYQHTHNTIYVVCFTTFAIISEEQPTGSVRVLIRRLTLLVHDLSLGVTRYFSLFFYIVRKWEEPVARVTALQVGSPHFSSRLVEALLLRSYLRGFATGPSPSSIRKGDGTMLFVYEDDILDHPGIDVGPLCMYLFHRFVSVRGGGVSI